MARPTRRRSLAEEFGDRVRTERQQRDWTQERLAEAAGVHVTFIGRVERAQRGISLTHIVRLAAALGVDPGDLIRDLRP